MDSGINAKNNLVVVVGVVLVVIVVVVVVVLVGVVDNIGRYVYCRNKKYEVVERTCSKGASLLK